MAKPAPYSGLVEECNGFILQCSLALEMQPHLYTTEKAKIAFIISLLTGRALQWAETIWTQAGTVTRSLDNFVAHFREVFGTPAGGSSAGEQLYNLRQGNMSINDYALKFRTLAAASEWNERSLLTTYRQELESRLHLAAFDNTIGLERFIQLSIRVANHMHSCMEDQQAQPGLMPLLRRPENISPPEPAHEPMQIDNTRLTLMERHRRLSQGLCLYWGFHCWCNSRAPVVSTAQPHPLLEVWWSPEVGRMMFPWLFPTCSTSAKTYSQSFFFVAKKDGGLRPCIDYRALNKITVKFRYPLPLVPAALEHLHEARVFTKLDLRSAYNLIRIREGDEWKTAFVTPTGHYEYCIMPYGLVNAPSVFQDFMHEVLREFLHQFVLVYIDDILIYSRSMAEHRHHVAEVLQHLRENNLFLKAEKCSFHQTSVKFLGYNIDQNGIQMDEGKVTAIKNWPIPTSVKKLQRFLGFSNFYRRFIRNYSSISSPLTNLLKNKPKSLSWTPSATEAFNTLKNAFISAPILVHPDPEKAFVIEVDASTTVVGAVLSQQQGDSGQTPSMRLLLPQTQPGGEALWHR